MPDPNNSVESCSLAAPPHYTRDTLSARNTRTATTCSSVVKRSSPVLNVSTVGQRSTRSSRHNSLSLARPAIVARTREASQHQRGADQVVHRCVSLRLPTARRWRYRLRARSHALLRLGQRAQDVDVPARSQARDTVNVAAGLVFVLLLRTVSFHLSNSQPEAKIRTVDRFC